MVDSDDAPTAGADVLAGTPYSARRQIGSGAMGEVYEAVHVALKKPVVVKILRAIYTKHTALVDRMRLEAQAIAHLRHPNIVAGHDFGTVRGRPYIVMEHLEGRTLSDEVRVRGALPYAEAADIVIQVLAGLAEAHHAGLVHRDIKPGNLFLCAPDREGRRVAKILDFGIAKVLLPDAGGKGPAPLIAPTAEGLVVGSPRYLSPEQARGERVEPRSDLYSLGAVLYFLLTGSDPFKHRVGAALLIAHRSETPKPPTLLVPGLPRALDRVVLRALAKRLDYRFPSAETFSTALGIAARQERPTPWAHTEIINVDELRPRRAPRNGTVPVDIDALRRRRQAATKPTLPSATGDEQDADTLPVEQPTVVVARPADPPSPWSVTPARARSTSSPRVVDAGIAVLLVLVAIAAVAALSFWIHR